MEIDRILLPLIDEVLRMLGSPATNINIEQENSTYRVNIETEDTNLLIGYHGETIRALEHIIKLLFWKKTPSPEVSIVVDIQNYRKRQEKNVLEMADRKADIARKTQKTQILPPMSPYFRRVVHLHLGQFEDLETVSIGEGDRRQITIKVK